MRASSSLRASTSCAVVTGEERRAVLAAMAMDFCATAHWETCERGHPFTVGKCATPTQRTRCPQCGAPVGWRDHRPVQGVRGVQVLEVELRLYIGAMARGVGAGSGLYERNDGGQNRGEAEGVQQLKSRGYRAHVIAVLVYED